MTTVESTQPQAQPDPVPSPPRMTEKDFVDELQALIKRGEEAGLSPMTILGRVVFRRSVSTIDKFFADLESNLGTGSGKKG